MKIKELNPQQQEFKPLELMLTIETKRELEMLWCIFNSSPVAMASFLNDVGRSSHNIDEYTASEICAQQNRSAIWSFFEEKMKRQ